MSANRNNNNNKSWFQRALDYRYVTNESVEDDTMLTISLSGFAYSFINGTLHGYIANAGSLGNILQYGIGHTFANFITTSLVAGIPGLMYEFTGEPIFFYGASLVILIAPNLLGFFPAEVAGYELRDQIHRLNLNTGNSFLNTLLTIRFGRVNALTALEVIPVAAWTAFHLYRLFRTTRPPSHLNSASYNTPNQEEYDEPPPRVTQRGKESNKTEKKLAKSQLIGVVSHSIIMTLPADVVYKITGYLSPSQLYYFAKANHQHYQFATQNQLWLAHLARHFSWVMTKPINAYEEFNKLTKAQYSHLALKEIKYVQVMIEGDYSEILKLDPVSFLDFAAKHVNYKLITYLRNLNDIQLNKKIFAKINKTNYSSEEVLFFLILLDLDDTQVSLDHFVTISQNKLIEKQHLWTLVVKFHSLNFAKMLLRRQVNCNLNYEHESHPLYDVAGYGQLDMLDLLLEKGAQVDLLFKNKTALCEGVYCGHMAIVKRLLEKGADVNFCQHPPIHIKPEILALLLENGLNLNRDGKFETLIFDLIKKNKYNHLKIILEHYKNKQRLAEIHWMTKNDESPLSYALRVDNFKICQLLIAYHAKIDYRAKDGRTLLHAACVYSYIHSIRYIQLFIQSGINPAQACDDKKKPSAVTNNLYLKKIMFTLESIASHDLNSIVYIPPTFMDELAYIPTALNQFVDSKKNLPLNYSIHRDQFLQAKLCQVLLNACLTPFGMAFFLYTFLNYKNLIVVKFLEKETEDSLLEYVVTYLGFDNLQQAQKQLYLYLCQCLGNSQELMETLQLFIINPVGKMFINPPEVDSDGVIRETLYVNLLEIKFKESYESKLVNDRSTLRNFLFR